jgi:hypothetical protein
VRPRAPTKRWAFSAASEELVYAGETGKAQPRQAYAAVALLPFGLLTI